MLGAQNISCVCGGFLTPTYTREVLGKTERLYECPCGRERKLTVDGDVMTLETKNKRGTCPDQLIQQIMNVSMLIGRTPTLQEFVEKTRGQRYKHLLFKVYGSWKNALKIAGLKSEEPRKSTYKTRYSDEELSEYLRIFEKEHKKEARTSDCDRGLIPESTT